jgi:hypothetical protein
MALEDLNPSQLRQIELIRQRRRELVAEATRDNRDLLEIVNAAATRRSEKRHRFMLLAGGIVGVAAPLILQKTAGIDISMVRAASGLLLLTIIVGAVFDAIDEKRTTPVLLRAGVGVRMAAAQALAEDSKLIELIAANKASPDIEAMIAEATRRAESADSELRKAGERFTDVTVLESVVFFGSFVLGVLLLLYAVAMAGQSTLKAG